MKFLTIVGLALCMWAAGYLLLHEKQMKARHYSQQKIINSTSKLLGEKKEKEKDEGNLSAYALQKKRIASESVIKFENTDTHESYELDEEELGEFASDVASFKNLNRTNQYDLASPAGEREYYEIDN